MVAVFGILLVLIALVAFGPALIAVVSQTVAEAFGCQVDLNRVIPCEIGGKDYGQTFYDLGFSIWYSYLSLPLGAVLATIWAVAAFVVLLRGRREDGGPGTTPAMSPGEILSARRDHRHSACPLADRHHLYRRLHCVRRSDAISTRLRSIPARCSASMSDRCLLPWRTPSGSSR